MLWPCTCDNSDFWFCGFRIHKRSHSCLNSMTVYIKENENKALWAFCRKDPVVCLGQCHPQAPFQTRSPEWAGPCLVVVSQTSTLTLLVLRGLPQLSQDGTAIAFRLQTSGQLVIFLLDSSFLRYNFSLAFLMSFFLIVKATCSY